LQAHVLANHDFDSVPLDAPKEGLNKSANHAG
jgi:hypothetical protein